MNVCESELILGAFWGAHALIVLPAPSPFPSFGACLMMVTVLTDVLLSDA